MNPLNRARTMIATNCKETQSTSLMENFIIIICNTLSRVQYYIKLSNSTVTKYHVTALLENINRLLHNMRFFYILCHRGLRLQYKQQTIIVCTLMCNYFDESDALHVSIM